MWIEKTKDGKYKFREQYKNPLTGKYNKVSVTMDKKTNINKRKAQILLEQKIQDKLSHIQDGNIKQGITFGQVVDEWEPIYKKQVLSTTYLNWKTFKEQLRHFIQFDYLVDQITPKYLMSLYEDLLYKKGYTKAHVSQLNSKINQILTYAYKHDYTNSIATANLSIDWPKERKTMTIEQKFLEDDELKAVLDYVYDKNKVYGAVLEWQSLTGMRFGEASTMQVKNIHEDNGKFYADVTGTMVYSGLKVSEYYKSSLTKTDAGRRTVFLPQQAIKIFKEYSQGKTSNDFLFLVHHHLVPIGEINYILKQAKDDLHIDKLLSSHTMRHTHVSKLAEMGVPLYVIQNRVGHSNSKVTEQVYMHVTKKAKQKYEDLIKHM